MAAVYHNATNQVLHFQLGDELFEVRPGQECEIERKMVDLVKRRGLLLTPGHAPVPDAEVVEPTLAPRRNPFRPRIPDVSMTQVPLGTREEPGAVEFLEREGISVPDDDDDGLGPETDTDDESTADAVDELVKLGAIGRHRAARVGRKRKG